jgi:hypothetical protein
LPAGTGIGNVTCSDDFGDDFGVSVRGFSMLEVALIRVGAHTGTLKKQLLTFSNVFIID